ncbi:MAG: translation elongation factor Ts [Clostridiales bacterium]|nr:translation elongation factor Ts [Clostridiales bacterium]
MEITAKDVAKLRDITGVGMMACKKALIATDGDIDKACEYLREQGMSIVAKKASRIAAEGAAWAYISDDKHTGALVEVNCESDFVAKSDVFTKLCEDIAKAAAQSGEEDAEKLKAVKTAEGTIDELITAATAKTGEKISLRRATVQKNAGAIEEAYIHMGGKMGTLVEISADGATSANTADIVAMAHDIAMHIAAFQPPYVRKSDVPQDAVDHEREIIKQQLMNDEKNKNKPENVLAKIAEGKLGNFYKENCLLYQAFAKDPSITVEQLVEATAKKTGAKLDVVRFTKFVMGEGIEKRTDNLAEEVAKLSANK